MRRAKSDSYKTRQFTVKDLDQVITVNKRCLPENYPSSFFIDLYERFPKSFLVTESVGDGEVVGYIMCRIERGLSNFGFRLARKGHVVSVAVVHEHRNRGIGQNLVAKALEAMRDYGASEYILEVRVSNKSAVSLYKRLGFNDAKIMKGYYSDGEDAYLMTKQVEEPALRTHEEN
nr:ribosomal protein S18-alanine N-acetyltransferase [Candidatus Njordarchaeota archaeon]